MVPDKEVPTLFTVWDTAVRVKPAVLANLLIAWVALSWLAGQQFPDSSWLARLLVGALSTTALLVADFGHALAHIVSARYAAAPMDEILVSAGMPRTLYFDNDVPPQTHRMRSLGGPIFSALGLLVSLFLRTLTSPGSPARMVADWSCIAATASSWLVASCHCPWWTAAPSSSGRWWNAAAHSPRPTQWYGGSIWLSAQWP